MNSFAVLAALALCCAGSTSARAAPTQATVTVQLRGYVPVICRAELTDVEASPQAGVVSLGRLEEFCNDPNGYEIWLDYTPELAGASLIIDGQTVALSSGGSIRIVQSRSPARLWRLMSLVLPRDGIRTSLSVRVVAL